MIKLQQNRGSSLQHRHRHRTCFINSATSSASSSSSSPSSSLLPLQQNHLTRLQREAQDLVALDVEFVHIRATSTGQRFQIPVEICIVDGRGQPLLRTLCNGFDAHSLDHTSIQWEFKGGIPVAEWITAPPFRSIRPEILSILGKTRAVVGHNVGKDLAALGLDERHVPLERRRDTMRYAALQGPSGFGRTLAELALKKLGRPIQVKARHDPEEDAVAALDLYLKYCHYDPSLMGYEDLVEYYAAEMLVSMTAAPSVSISDGEEEAVAVDSL